MYFDMILYIFSKQDKIQGWAVVKKKLVYNEFRLKGTVRASWRIHLNKKDVLLRNVHRWLFVSFFFLYIFFSVSRAYAGRRGEHWQTRFSRLRNRRRRRRRLGFLRSRCRDEKNKIKYTLLQFRILDNKGRSEIRVKDNATLKCKKKRRIPIYNNVRMHFPNYLDSCDDDLRKRRYTCF